MSIRTVLGKTRLYLDGAMGTMLQERGLEIGEIPEKLNFTQPQMVKEVHKLYLQAGSNIITTNTFGANRYKAQEADYTVEEVILQGVKLAKEAIQEVGHGYVAQDMGPTGKLVAPVGEIPFDEIYEVYKEQVEAGVKAGVDVILLETFTDLYELKAAVLAIKENSELPIFATMSFEPNGRTFFGTSLEAMVVTLEGLGVDALGINCSLGPKELQPLVKKIMRLATKPVLIQPNAGLPIIKEGKAYYDIKASEFATYMQAFAELGVSVMGGCCGTTPEYIQAMIEQSKEVAYNPPQKEYQLAVCSSTKVVRFDTFCIVGERLNPTGKSGLKEAIENKDEGYIIEEAMDQKDEGAHILDVNVGIPMINEVEVLPEIIQCIQSSIDLPLQIDSSNPQAIDRAARLYNGKPIINGVTGEKQSLEAVLPIAKRYGTAIIGLTLDENGIPKTTEERLAIAKRIVEAGLAYGIPKQDILIDPLMLTAAAQQEQVQETLEAIRLIKQEIGVKVILGVSNVSFGLPKRDKLNETALVMSMTQGLDAAIINTSQENMIQAIDAYNVLMDRDEYCQEYIQKYR